MTNMSKKELIKAIKPRYLKSVKKDKGKILDEFCRNTGYDRKYAIQIFKAGYDYCRVEREGRKSRRKKYSSEVMAVAIKVWELLDYPYGARLKPILNSTLESMIRHKEIFVSEKTKFLLGKISSKTLDRRLKKERQIRRLDKNWSLPHILDTQSFLL